MKSKIKGSALQMSIFVIVVVALLLMSFVMYIFTFNKFKQQSKNFNTVIKTAHLEIETYIANENAQLDYGSFNKNSFNELGIDHSLNVDAWGALKLIKSTATKNTYKFSKIALVGSAVLHDSLPALYMLDGKNALVVVGNTKIEGTAFLSEKGVKSGSIEGVSYYNSQYIFGEVLLSDKSNIKQILDFESLNQFITNTNNFQSKNNVFKPNDSIVNSFHNTTLRFDNNHDIMLSDISLTGNIIISSRTKIKVLPTTKLTDIILMAPIVEIADNTVGAFQIIAENTISVGKNCKFNYPSVIAIVAPANNQSNANVDNRINNDIITIGERTVINGAIIYQSDLTSNKSYPKPNIWLQKEAILNGQIFNSHYTELDGTVNGSVYTKNFMSRKRGSTYINHIYDGTINSNALNAHFVGLELIDTQKDIIKWLY